MSSERVALGDRSLFPELATRAYLAHAASSPLSVRVCGAVQRLLADFASGGLSAFLGWMDQRERLREKLARLLGAEAGEVALTAGTTPSLVHLALCFPWRSGDTVVLTSGEFPANVSPWQNAAALFGLRLVFLPAIDGRASVDDVLVPLEAALRGGARLVAASAVQFQTGFHTPLAAMTALCRRYGAEIAVDAIQAAGVVPLDVHALDLDYVAGGAHKWLMGMAGIGYLYAKPERARALEPRTAGWLSHEHGVRFLFEGPGELRYDRPVRRDVQFVEGGSADFAASAALEAAIDPLLELGPAAIFAHVTRYLDVLECGLTERGFTSVRSALPELRSGILSVVPPPGLAAAPIVRALGARGVASSMPDGLVRFAPHFPNALDEIPFVLDAVDESLRELANAPAP